MPQWIKSQFVQGLIVQEMDRNKMNQNWVSRSATSEFKNQEICIPYFKKPTAVGGRAKSQNHNLIHNKNPGL